MLEILPAIFLGILLGVFTGLIPGIHVNLVSALAVASSPLLLDHVSPLTLAIGIVSLAVTHTFLDSIPSIFLGAPDPDMALSVLPGHRMLLSGLGYQAVKLTVVGSIGCLLLTLLLVPLAIPLLPQAYAFLQPLMGWMLLGVAVTMTLMDRNKIASALVFLVSGVLGMLVLDMPGLRQPLFPLLSGLFGTSALLLSLGQKVSMPRQRTDVRIAVPGKELVKSLGAGVLSGSLTGLLPGLGAAQASIIGMIVVGRVGVHAFLVLVGGINTVNFAFSLGTFYALEKARNGAIVAVMRLMGSASASQLAVLLLSAWIAGCLAVVLALGIAKGFSKVVGRIPYTALTLSVVCFVSLLVLLMTGWIGGLVLIVSTCVGMLAPLMGVKRSQAMGCILLPVMLFFIQ